jgi:hypothetical protein
MVAPILKYPSLDRINDERKSGMNGKKRGGEALFIISTRQRSRMDATRCLEGGKRRTGAPGSTPPDLSLNRCVYEAHPAYHA